LTSTDTLKFEVAKETVGTVTSETTAISMFTNSDDGSKCPIILPLSLVDFEGENPINPATTGQIVSINGAGYIEVNSATFDGVAIRVKLRAIT